MKTWLLSAGLGGGFVAYQSAASLLDSEYESMSQSGADILETVSGAMANGISAQVVIISTVLGPAIYQGLKILHGYAETHQFIMREEEERKTSELQSQLRMQEEEHRQRMGVAQDAVIQDPLEY